MSLLRSCASLSRALLSEKELLLYLTGISFRIWIPQSKVIATVQDVVHLLIREADQRRFIVGGVLVANDVLDSVISREFCCIITAR